MGRTNLVAPGDINAIFVNPANAAYIDDWAVTSMYTSLLEGEMNYTLLGGGKKFDFGGMGLLYLGGGTSGIAVTTRDADGRVVASGTNFDYSNSVIALSWGRMIREDLAGGAMLKSISKGFSGGYAGGSGFDLDLGLVYKQKENLTLGLAIQNALPTGVSWDNGTSEDVPMQIKGGLSYLSKKDLLVNVDADLTPFALHTGVEWMVNPVFALRGGLDQVPDGGAGTTLNFCLGMGTIVRGFKFDYAYYKDSTLDANSTHYFTLGYVAPSLEKMAAPKPKPKRGRKPGVKSEKVNKIKAYIGVLEKKLADAKQPERIAKLKGMIEEQKIRLQNELE
jgi:hypothetical protein